MKWTYCSTSRGCAVSFESSCCLNRARLMNYPTLIFDFRHSFWICWGLFDWLLGWILTYEVDTFCYFLFSQTFWVFYTFQRKTKHTLWWNCKHMKFVKFNYSFLAERFWQVFLKLPKLYNCKKIFTFLQKLLQILSVNAAPIFVPFTIGKRHLLSGLKSN